MGILAKNYTKVNPDRTHPKGCRMLFKYYFVMALNN